MEKDRPGVIAPPPLIMAVAFAVGVFLRNLLPRVGSPPAGAALAIVSLFVAGSAFVTMIRSHTSVDPYRPATTLVTSGPFRFSRNPLYLSLTLLYLGLALFFRIVPALLSLPVALLILQVGVIHREERYLERKFGEQYRVYRSHVRRWV